MKRVSTKMFFSVIWKGICQVLGWFLGLFGYKRDGKFAKCVWGLFSISAAVIMVIMACGLTYTLGREYYNRHIGIRNYAEKSGGQYVSNRIGYINFYDEKGFLIDKATGEKVLTDIEWIAAPLGNDTLVCYSDGKLRGYFSKNTGKAIIEPKYRHAWIFSDGLACVEDNGFMKFIDGTGDVVIDSKLEYRYGMEGFVFHGGYCIVCTKDGTRYGLMDKTGKMVIPTEYDNINISSNQKYWSVKKGSITTVLDKNMNAIIPNIEGQVYLCDKCISVTMPDHTMRKYDYEGKLIDDFYISSVEALEYQTGELYYTKSSYMDEDEVEHDYLEEEHKRAEANLYVYSAGDDYKGLMAKDGCIVTKPLYEAIEAIGADLYLCTVSDGDKVVVDGKGKVVR